MARKLYPLGIQTFERIRTEDRFYVDKTEYIYNMVHTNGVYVFLSRPRRFGKSLLVSTLQSYFEGRKELFKGLAMEKLEKEWTEYPVLHFDLSGGKHQEEDQLNRYLDYILKENERRFGIECDAVDANVRLAKFSQLSIFSELNNINNISMDEEYAGICGITEEELLSEMSAFINKGDIDGALNLLQTFLATVITMEPEDHIYIMELKFCKTADEALAQINANHYADAFAMSGKKIIKVGIGFDIKDERNITEWRVE